MGTVLATMAVVCSFMYLFGVRDGSAFIWFGMLGSGWIGFVISNPLYFAVARETVKHTTIKLRPLRSSLAPASFVEKIDVFHAPDYYIFRDENGLTRAVTSNESVEVIREDGNLNPRLEITEWAPKGLSKYFCINLASHAQKYFKFYIPVPDEWA